MHDALYGVACELAAICCVLASAITAGRDHRRQS